MENLSLASVTLAFASAGSADSVAEGLAVVLLEVGAFNDLEVFVAAGNTRWIKATRKCRMQA